MTNNLRDIVTHWYSHKDECEWVLCTLYAIEGSSYRKPGAMMMVSGDGLQLGMLSGGCLEADIQREAKKVMASQTSRTLTYDATDEDDLTFQLGIGCGGIVHIILQPVTAVNQYLGLTQLHDAIITRQQGVYYQCINPCKESNDLGYFESVRHTGQWSINRRTKIIKRDMEQWLLTYISPEPHLLIAGAGSDAIPVYKLAKLLGWSVSIWDPRPANGRREHFQHVDYILRNTAQELAEFCNSTNVSSVILMSHNLELDSQALKVLSSLPLNYLGILGPIHRREEVLKICGMTNEDVTSNLFGPVGLNVGGETPESIALSMIAEMHASLCEVDGSSLSHQVPSK